MHNIIWGSVAVSLLVAVMVPPAGVPDDARKTIKAANDAWLPAIERQDAAAVAEAYADDGVFVGATGQVATGRPAIEKMMKERFAAGRVLSGSLEQDGIRMEGTLIYEWGHAETEFQSASGKITKARGRYLTVWKQNAAKHWEIIRNLSLVD